MRVAVFGLRLVPTVPSAFNPNPAGIFEAETGPSPNQR